MKRVNKDKPEKTLISNLSYKAGRDSAGRVSTRHKGGRQKRYYRDIDFKRNKYGVFGKVVAFEYDPNRNVDIALVHYTDGDKRYILAPLGLKIGDRVIADKKTEIKTGNAMMMKNIPVGTSVHNLELNPGAGGKLVRGAGTMALIIALEGGLVHVKLPSGEIRQIRQECMATVGQLGNIDMKTRQIGNAGRARRMGIRPSVRGTAQHPGSHPHGGGEGRSGVGLKHPKSPWGKLARGGRTRKNKKYSDQFIIKKRK